ncbi:hypothetical protein F7725_014345 [Dissostichus mawsoni]|uniref:Uncharacterized protein n=1 Tax=Dissostichus mawsoni TaxID=36200 RepID=A0A7J5YYR1_DISMA|nr:hypothetical protein F7725_014345 [Dissostichus mawsoni]
MKTVIVALFVLLAVSQSEALRCHCGGLQNCGGSQDSCIGRIWVCAKVINIVGSSKSFSMPPIIMLLKQKDTLPLILHPVFPHVFTDPNFLQGCLSATDCMMLNRPDSNYFMGCWLEEGCKELNKPGGYSGSCCTQDLCNT